MTFEEVKTKYPIGTIYKTYVREFHDEKIYNNATDIKYLREEYDNVELGRNNICICTRTQLITEIITGYVYTRNRWSIMVDEGVSYEVWREGDEDDES